MEAKRVVANLPEDSAKVLEDIAEEIEEQRRKFGDALDDDHSANDWIALCVRYATRNITHNHLSESAPDRVLAFRKNMQVVAAIAASAMRSCDRRLHEVEMEAEAEEMFA